VTAWLATVAVALASATAPSPADELEAIASHVGEAGRDATRARLEAFVTAHPGSDDAARALLLVGQLWRKDGRDDLARQAWERLVAASPESPAALDAALGLADLALTARDYDDAERRFAQLTRVGQGRVLYQAQLGLEQTHAEQTRFRLTLAVAAALLALALWRGASAARAKTLWPLPEEVVVAGPVAALLVLASFAQPPAEALAVRLLAFGGLLLVWVNSAAFAARPPRGARRVLEVLLGLAQASGLLFCAIIAGGLWTRFVETLAVGAE